jgi:Ca2+-binding RTX toxin-like protein
MSKGDAGSDVIAGDMGRDTVSGNYGDDRLFGNADNDLIDRHSGNDSIFGGQGNDTILGSSRSDVISGDLGDDSLIGGIEGDVFNFRPGDGNDIIADFQNGFDKIGLMQGLSFEQLQIVGVENDTQINGNGLTITLQSVNVGAIDPSDFVLV